MLISEDQLKKSIALTEQAMKIVEAHIVDQAIVKAIRRNIMLSIVTLVPEAYQHPEKPK